MTRKKWTEDEKQYIRDNYLIKSPQAMADYLNRTKKSVVHFLTNNRLLQPVTDHIGEKYNKLTIVGRAIKATPSGNEYYAICDCDCGSKNNKIRISAVTSGRIESCGCRVVVRTKNGLKVYENGSHGMRHTKMYTRWKTMIQRCENPNSTNYCHYGARGIKVCDEWRDFNTYKKWAMSHGYSDELSIDRIDVNGNYCPENCKFSTFIEQMNNMQNNVYWFAFGQNKTVRQWSESDICIVKFTTLRSRLNKGWTIEEALTTPEMVNQFRMK